MRLTMMTDYALRLLMHVGREGGRLCTIAEVAAAQGLSEAHLMKITHQLGLAGWLETVRGKGGGMRLALAPEAINLGAVVRSVEPDFALVECLTPDSHASQCRLDGRCRLTGIFRGALESFLAHLDAHTLADVLPPATSPVRITRMPQRAAGRRQG